MKIRSLAPGAAVVLSIAVSACGGSTAPSLSQFRSSFKTEKVSFRTLGLDLQRAIVGAQTKTDAQLATELGALATRASAEASQLAKLNPPAKYQAETRGLIAGFRSVATDLRAISTAAVKHDRVTARSATITLLHDAARVKVNDDAITKGLGLPAGS